MFDLQLKRWEICAVGFIFYAYHKAIHSYKFGLLAVQLLIIMSYKPSIVTTVFKLFGGIIMDAAQTKTNCLARPPEPLLPSPPLRWVQSSVVLPSWPRWELGMKPWTCLLIALWPIISLKCSRMSHTKGILHSAQRAQRPQWSKRHECIWRSPTLPQKHKSGVFRLHCLLLY